VRDLLHERVTAQKLATTPGEDQHRLAMTALQNRWDTLIAREHVYRREAGVAAACS